MRRIFFPDSRYKKQARFIAALWTLLIFIGCLTPGRDLPKVDVPMADKWTHFVMFGGFAFLWLCGFPKRTVGRYTLVFLLAALLGSATEILQGVFTSLGRSMELMDGVADAVGGLLGTLAFALAAPTERKR